MEVRFTSKGIFVAAGKAPGKNILLLNTDGNIISKIRLHSRVKAMDADANGDLVAAIDEFNTLHIYDSNGRELWNTSTGSNLFCVDVSDNGEYIVVGGVERCMVLR